jgi:hypothetical protein
MDSVVVIAAAVAVLQHDTLMSAFVLEHRGRDAAAVVEHRRPERWIADRSRISLSGLSGRRDRRV